MRLAPNYPEEFTIMCLFRRALVLSCLTLFSVGLISAASMPAFAQGAPAEHRGGEVNLVVPDLGQVTFLNGISGPTLLMSGLLVSVLGMVFGLVIYQRLRNMPVHSSMR